MPKGFRGDALPSRPFFLRSNKMQITEAYNLGVRYMNEHNLCGWKFEVNDMTRYYGLCDHQKKTIYLSAYAIFFKTHEEVVDIIKHEIAHALVGQGHNHDKVWRRKCLEIGGNGKRCGSVAFIKKYEVKCDWCGRRYRGANLKKKYGECECGPLGVIQHTPTKEFEEYEAWLKNNNELISSKGQDATPSQVASSF